MIKLVTAFLLGFWLYFGTCFTANPTLAAIITPQTTDQVEKLDLKHGMEMKQRCDRDQVLRKKTGFNNRLVPTKVSQFLISVPRDYYTVKNIETLKTLAKEKQALLVDVREPLEYASGHIKGAINIPLRGLTQNLNLIPKNRPVILLCSTGYRTAMGVMALQMLGYSNVKGFPPSVEGWKAAGEQLEQ
jgi:rhodanese-related sulfurtransferase